MLPRQVLGSMPPSPPEMATQTSWILPPALGEKTPTSTSNALKMT